MHPQQTRIFFALSASLLLVCLFLAASTDESPISSPEAFLGPLPTDSVQRLTLTSSEGTLEAHHRDDDWFLTRPVPGAGDGGVLDDLVNAISRWQVTANLSTASLADHGLETPSYTISLQRIDGTAPTLHVGAVAPGGAHTYARVDEGAVIVLEGDVTALLGRPFELYRRRTLFAGAESGVLRIDWQMDTVSWSASRNEDGHWSLTPSGTPARTGSVEGFLAALKATNLESFQDGVDPASSGLAPPRGRIVLSSAEGEWELLIGAEKLGGTLVQTSDGLVGTIGDLGSLVPNPESLERPSASTED
ncbi:MAG: DUF4340 domain-containing protein [Myxococcota bacterium]|nr:DUF4340 domain-containing protein [Myxococcota bacterium]